MDKSALCDVEQITAMLAGLPAKPNGEPLCDILSDSPPFGEFAPPATSRWIFQQLARLPDRRWARRMNVLLRRCALNRRRQVYDVTAYGIQLRLHPFDNVTEKQLLCGPQLFDPEERQLIQDRATPDLVFVDIGANAGIYSLLAASTARTGKVIAVEPDPVMHERLVFNKAVNHFDQLLPVRCAVSDRRGETTMFINHRNRGQNSLVNATGTQVTVACIPLLSLFDQFSVGSPDILKMDIEGLEHDVLKHFFQTASRDRYPRTLIIEQHEVLDDDALQLALQYGYRLLKRTSAQNVVLDLTGK